MVAAPCFIRGTRITTPGGEMPVEELRVGSEVLISKKAGALVKFIGVRRLNNDMDRWPASVEPIVIKSGALGPDTPVRELWLSPEHAVYLDGHFFNARELIDGRRIAPLGKTSIHQIKYYHIDLGFHDLVYAEGAATESYGGQGRSAFDNHGEFLKLYGPSAEIPYAPFAPRGCTLVAAASKWGSAVCRQLPGNLQRVGRPIAHKTYSVLDFLDRMRLRRKLEMSKPESGIPQVKAALHRPDLPG